MRGVLYEFRDGRIHTVAIQFSAAHHCNLRCAHCSHLSPYVPRRLPAAKSFAADLQQLATVIRARTIVLLGGEPLLNPELPAMARLARESGIARTVTVTTNGLLLPTVTDDLWRYVDVVRVSLYPQTPPSEAVLEAAAAQARTHRVRLIVEQVREFRTAAVTSPHPMDLWTRIIYSTCGVAHRQHCHMFSDGWLYKCSMPVNLPGYLDRLGLDGYTPSADGVDLHAPGDLLARVREYLFARQPLEACRYCLGWLGRRVPQRQLSAGEQNSPGDRPVRRATHLSYGRALYALARCARWATVDRYLTRPARPRRDHGRSLSNVPLGP